MFNCYTHYYVIYVSHTLICDLTGKQEPKNSKGKKKDVSYINRFKHK